MSARDRIANVVYENLGTDTWNEGHKTYPPGDGWKLDFGPDSYPSLAVWNNDGFELWLGTSDRWHTHMPRKQARRLALHILACDVRLWFGLRRKLWYWALRRRVARHKAMVQR